MVLALDVGTSGVRGGLYDRLGAVSGRSCRVALDPVLTEDGGVEHDPARLLDGVLECLDTITSGRGGERIDAVGIATFWHGLLGFDERNRPQTPVYLWADTRSAAEVRRLRTRVDEETLRARTGCHLHPSYWPAKLRWLRRERAIDVDRVARWGSVGELLECTLFGRAATTVSMASGTGLFDQDRATWDPEALELASIGPSQLFPLCDRDDARRGLREPWASRWPALRDAAWFPAIGDGAASNVGSGCVDRHRIALNVGTSAAMRVAHPEPGPAPRGLWRYRLDRRVALIGGATSEGGNVHAWCLETLRLPSTEAIEAALAADPGPTGLIALPFSSPESARLDGAPPRAARSWASRSTRRRSISCE